MASTKRCNKKSVIFNQQIISLVYLFVFIIIFEYTDHCQAQGIMGHMHPHKVMSKAPCPACLDRRLTQHYRARKCHPVIPGGCKCPSRFNCHGYLDENNDGVLKMVPFSSRTLETISSSNSSIFEVRGRSLETSIDDHNQCYYNGTHYQIGEIVPTENVCRICVCSYMSDGTVNVDCHSKIECPTPETRAMVDSFQGYFTLNTQIMPQSISRIRRRPQHSLMLDKQQSAMMTLFCYDYYTHDQCCPRQECMPVNARTGRTIRPRKTCRYAGKEYHLGEKIRLESIFKQKDGDSNGNDSLNQINHLPINLAETLACMRCICTEQWNSSIIEENPHKLQELLTADQISCRKKSCHLDLDPRFRRGCIPVYDEDKCCPVDFICPRTRQMALRVRGVDYGSKLCHFEGRKYPVGARIYQSKNSAAECVDCECRIPPEFTCLKRKDCNKKS